MTALKQRLEALIAASGPIPVQDYMAICLFDPDAGYYTTREPFGVAGDFTTAPEISQMFGEIVAVWLYSGWVAAGRPIPATFAEIGPGRGTLMKDALRTWHRLDPSLCDGASFALIETSPRLVEVQRTTLADAGAPITWHGDVSTLPDQPLFIVGNELFDAVPMRQFVRHGGRWIERAVGLDDRGELAFVLGTAAVDADLLPAGAASAPDGSIAELSPAREALMHSIAARISKHGGAGLFIDYGHLRPGLGDTFQAVRAHRPEGVFDNSGKADLTSHVDFAALAAAARAEGLAAFTATQRDFLLAQGLLERAGALGRPADEATRIAVSDAVERLAGPNAMGDLFKVLAVLPAGVAVAPFSTGASSERSPRA